MELLVAKLKGETLKWLHSIAGELATTTLARLDQTLSLYREMPATGARESVVLQVATVLSVITEHGLETSQRWT